MKRGAQTTIGGYLASRLHTLGVRHIFGIPGDYVLGLYKLFEQSPIQLVGTTREDSAGFAADAYARLNGIGAACVTYCVGGLNTVNAVACAYAERSPVVLLSGPPGLGERRKSPLLTKGPRKELVATASKNRFLISIKSGAPGGAYMV